MLHVVFVFCNNAISVKEFHALQYVLGINVYLFIYQFRVIGCICVSTVIFLALDSHLQIIIIKISIRFFYII